MTGAAGTEPILEIETDQKMALMMAVWMGYGMVSMMAVLMVVGMAAKTVEMWVEAKVQRRVAW